MELETLIRTFRANHNMSGDPKPFAISGSPIAIRSQKGSQLGRRALITTELAATLTHAGWLKLLELNLANQARHNLSLGYVARANESLPPQAMAQASNTQSPTQAPIQSPTGQNLTQQPTTQPLTQAPTANNATVRQPTSQDKLLLWRLTPDEPSQQLFDKEIEDFALGVKYWKGKLQRLARW